jgi:hypothetical protein
VQGFRFRVLGSRVQGFRFRVLGSGVKDYKLIIGVRDLGYRV